LKSVDRYLPVSYTSYIPRKHKRRTKAMTSLQNFASNTFANYALRNVSPDEDANGLFCLVPSSDGRWYQVRCVESKTNVYASHCNCSSFARHAHCTHIETTQRYWARFYKPVVEAPVKEVAKIVKVRKPRNGLVRKVRNGGLVKVAQPVQVVETAKITDISTRGNLSSNQGFRLMR
jgi:hypothetical protein